MKFGVDIGGTTVKIGVVEGTQIIDSFVVVTKAESLFDDVCLAIKQYMKEHNICDIEGIGFGVPGNIIDNYIYLLPNIGTKNLDLIEVVSKHFPGVKIAGGNDANVAALGEMMYHNEYKNACMLTLGTGVGCGIVLNGKILEGVHGAGGEVGHMLVADDYNFECGCGLKGCLETVSSATGVVRLAKYHKNQYKTILGDDFSAKDVFDAARSGDELACFVVDKVCYYLAKAISLLAVTVDVDVYYIGGGVSKAGAILIDGIKKHYEKIAFFAVKKAEIQAAYLLNDAGMLGAACLISE